MKTAVIYKLIPGDYVDIKNILYTCSSEEYAKQLCEDHNKAVKKHWEKVEQYKKALEKSINERNNSEPYRIAKANYMKALQSYERFEKGCNKDLTLTKSERKELKQNYVSKNVRPYKIALEAVRSFVEPFEYPEFIAPNRIGEYIQGELQEVCFELFDVI